MVTFLWSPPVGLSVGLTFLLAVDELVLEPKGAGGTVETYLITALLEPKPNWLANVVVAFVVFLVVFSLAFSGPRFLTLFVSSSSFNWMVLSLITEALKVLFLTLEALTSSKVEA